MLSTIKNKGLKPLAYAYHKKAIASSDRFFMESNLSQRESI
ncbi:hypothetical protein [Pseudanabaena sp. FACHB-1998]|nr:hypothetical protein [Pseudanabaena sp. FACHB-1998]